MKLKEYLDKRGMKMLYASEVLGIHRNTLTLITQGNPVSPEIAERIISWSNGEVEVDIIKGEKAHVRNRPKKFPQPT
jgi:plasmid maintenance system antidote protein VapI